MTLALLQIKLFHSEYASLCILSQTTMVKAQPLARLQVSQIITTAITPTPNNTAKNL